MCRVIEFRVPKNFRRRLSLPPSGQKAKVLKFKTSARKFPPDDWRILGLAVSDLTRFDLPHLH